MNKQDYEKSLREVGWDYDCIFSALHGYDMGSANLKARLDKATKALISCRDYKNSAHIVAEKCLAELRGDGCDL